MSSTVKVFLFASSRTTLFSILSCPSRFLYKPKVVSVFLFSGVLEGASTRRAAKAPSKSVNVFFHWCELFPSLFSRLFSRINNWMERVCSSSPIPNFISRFLILRCLTVSIAVTL